MADAGIAAGEGFPDVIRDGRRITRTEEGWHLTGVVRCLRPLTVLSFRHEDGLHEACWFTGPDGELRATGFEQLPRQDQAELQESATALFVLLARDILISVYPSPPEDAWQLAALSPALRLKLLYHWLSTFPAPEIRTGLPAEGFRQPRPSQAEQVVSPERLRVLLAAPHGVAENEPLVVLSPFSDTLVSGAEVLDDGEMRLWRFADRRAGSVFFLGAVLPQYSPGSRFTLFYSPLASTVFLFRTGNDEPFEPDPDLVRIGQSVPGRLCIATAASPSLCNQPVPADKAVSGLAGMSLIGQVSRLKPDTAASGPLTDDLNLPAVFAGRQT
ncbi:hypothetical protein LOC54_00140 [Acetobacter sp. AN02]|uniref:hypothetical protein n=1 Tax=Acetobacter sp. AN02 TaxID=2894186 RepID=UPI00243429C3|nr:hypothetical protein [Acetobacter sp. AN02]MDG6093535.1 hypothetical protein [Acetobacter sp. AN02]